MNHSRLFAAVVLVAASCAACGEASREATTVRIGVTASANEPRVQLTRTVVDRLSAAVDEGATRVVVYRQGERSGSAHSDEDFTIRDGNDIESDAARRRLGFEQNLSRLAGQLSGLGGTSTDLDPLSVLADMASADGPAVLVLQSSGLQTTGPLDLTRLGLDFDVAAVVASVPDDALPGLTGKDVIFSGLGQVVGDQPQLPPAARESLVQLWLGVCAKFGANSCTHDTEPVPGGASIGRAEVPVVDIGEVVHQDGLVHLPSSVLFKAGSDELAPGAREALAEVAKKFDGRTTARVIARTASSASAEAADDLTRRRGQRVVSALVELGVSRAAFTEVLGLGFTSPLAVDLDNAGDLIPDAAARNRSVVVELSQPKSSS
ncbi:OmpA family protein [Saccharothrix luteola]|uniref:OmpA family protein n=1 Tax=Saccharothrix luteola TaxID=2893018 RepID=UPI001E3AA9F8|nr:OmpA family protein [Saccharothrix luteola]MCC8249135.1 OmpA family protein [Saccharothrix luteola]